MTVTLKVLFSGLMLLANESDRNEAMMLLARAHDSQHGIPHHARLEFPCSPLVDEQRLQLCERSMPPPGIRLERCRGGNPCIPLEGLDVSFLPDGAPSTEGLRLSEGRKPENAMRHSNLDAEDLGWTPDLKRALEPLGLPSNVPSDLLKQPIGGGLGSLLNGRVRLTRGSLRVERFATRFGVWHFRTRNDYTVLRQEVADSLEYTSSPGTRSFVVRFARNDGTILLDLRFERDAILHVRNEPTTDDSCRIYKNHRVEHFRALYSLLGLNDGDLPLPETVVRPAGLCRDAMRAIEAGENPDPPGTGLGPVICMGAQTTTAEFPAWSGG